MCLWSLVSFGTEERPCFCCCLQKQTSWQAKREAATELKLVSLHWRRSVNLFHSNLCSYQITLISTEKDASRSLLSSIWTAFVLTSWSRERGCVFCFVFPLLLWNWEKRMWNQLTLSHCCLTGNSWNWAASLKNHLH